MARASIPYRTILPSIARAAATTFVGQFDDGNNPRLGGQFVINVTAAAAPSVVPTIDGFDVASGTWYNLLTGVAIVATGTTVLRIYPGFTPVANVTANDFLPPIWRLVMTHGNANSVTYSAAVLMR